MSLTRVCPHPGHLRCQNFLTALGESRGKLTDEANNPENVYISALEVSLLVQARPPGVMWYFIFRIMVLSMWNTTFSYGAETF